jgi:hypothetical protein
MSSRAIVGKKNGAGQEGASNYDAQGLSLAVEGGIFFRNPIRGIIPQPKDRRHR